MKPLEVITSRGNPPKGNPLTAEEIYPNRNSSRAEQPLSNQDSQSLDLGGKGSADRAEKEESRTLVPPRPGFTLHPAIGRVVLRCPLKMLRIYL